MTLMYVIYIMFKTIMSLIVTLQLNALQLASYLLGKLYIPMLIIMQQFNWDLYCSS